MNKLIVGGRVTYVRTNEKNKNIANFGVAVSKTFKDENGEYGTDFFNFSAFGKQAEYVLKNMNKGGYYIVEGRVEMNDKYTNFVANNIVTTPFIKPQQKGE